LYLSHKPNAFYRLYFLLAKRIDLQLVWKTSLQDIVESPSLLKSVSILTTEGPDGDVATHITLLVDGKIYFLRPEFLVRTARQFMPWYFSEDKGDLETFLTMAFPFDIRLTEM
jgi:hypothetical protein